MIHIERSADYALIRGIMAHPGVYSHLTDDFSPAIADFVPLQSDGLWYLVVWDGNELLGLWMLVPQNAVCWEIHTVLLPNAWGDRAHRAAQAVLEWIWTHTPCRRIVTNVPAENRLAYHFALSAGLEQYGVNDRSFLKHGRLQNQICLGISRPLSLPLFKDTETPIPGDSGLVAQSTGPKEG
jgi:RimJ/RimL family protein N-acetyltransferase